MESGIHDRALGAYLGLAAGDALGATVEFMTASEIASAYRVHHDIVGGGWLRLKPGQVTDDTQMSLALGHAIIATGGWSVRAVADAFLTWMHGRPVDIGNTCRRGIRRFMQDGSLCAPPSGEDAGNGAAMRNLPVVLATLDDAEALDHRSLEQARITHHHPLSDAATVTLARMTRHLITGGDLASCRSIADDLVVTHPQFRYNPWPGLTSGYIVDTVQTVLDAVFNTAGVEEAVVRAVNRGGDADTIGALTGQLAGALHGARRIPARWLRRLDHRVLQAIQNQVPALLALSTGSKSTAAIPCPPSLVSRPHPPPPSIVNRCNLSPWAIGSASFQQDPQPIEIAGVRSADRRLFDRLDGIGCPAERSRTFHEYLSVKFRLHEWAEYQAAARSALRASYVQFLHGWGADSNGRAGAVLKSWVESRFGLPPTYHGGKLPADPDAVAKYHVDQMRGATRSVGAFMQLDLLFTYCQYELLRRHPGERWFTLYRGTHDPDEYTVRDKGAGGTVMVQLNNLSSFTKDVEVAWEFGSKVWKARVPLAKIVFFSGLLPAHMLGGEAEFLVLGGAYEVKALL